MYDLCFAVIVMFCFLPFCFLFFSLFSCICFVVLLAFCFISSFHFRLLLFLLLLHADDDYSANCWYTGLMLKMLPMPMLCCIIMMLMMMIFCCFDAVGATNANCSLLNVYLIFYTLYICFLLRFQRRKGKNKRF